MGACTSKSQVLKDAGEAPVEKEEEEVVIKKETLTRVPVVDDEDKRQSLGHLFKEDQGSSEDNVAEQVKQETANEANKQPQEENDLNATKTPEPVALAGAQPVEASETEKALPTEGLKPENNVEAIVAPANKTEEDKPAEAAVVETSKQVVVEDKNKSIEKPGPAEATSTNLEASSAKVEEDNQKQENEEINKDDKKPEAEAPQMEVQENKKTDQEQQKPAPDEKKPLFKLWF